MPNTLLLKRSSTAAAVPTAGQLSIGELALNAADGKLFAKKADGLVVNVGQDAANVSIAGGSINGTSIGSSTPFTGKFTGVSLTGGVASTSTTTGDLVVAGGAGIGGAVNMPGLKILTTGELQTTGVGIGSVAGNARGAGSVDLQVFRTAATQVASGSKSVLAGGRDNTVFTDYATVSGGYGNTVTGAGYSTVAGGYSNYSGGNSSTIGGGGNNTTTASGGTIPGGRWGNASRFGQFAFSSSSITGPSGGPAGSAQYSLFVMSNKTTNATATDLWLDGTQTIYKFTIGDNTSLAYNICVSAHSTTDRTKQAVFNRRGKIYRLTTNASTALLAGEIQENQVGALAWTATVSADTTNGSLKITVVGEAATNINWVATVQCVETFG